VISNGTECITLIKLITASSRFLEETIRWMKCATPVLQLTLMESYLDLPFIKRVLQSRLQKAWAMTSFSHFHNFTVKSERPSLVITDLSSTIHCHQDTCFNLAKIKLNRHIYLSH